MRLHDDGRLLFNAELTMASYGSIWVKINNPAEDLPFLQQEYNNRAHLPEGLRFACAAVEIETVWAGQVLVEGCFYPMATASDLYSIVMQEFRLANPCA